MYWLNDTINRPIIKLTSAQTKILPFSFLNFHGGSLRYFRAFVRFHQFLFQRKVYSNRIAAANLYLATLYPGIPLTDLLYTLIGGLDLNDLYLKMVACYNEKWHRRSSVA